MRLFPQSFNGFLFQQQGRVASDFANSFDWDIQGITTSDLQRSQNFPLRVVKNYAGSIKVINVHLLDVDFARNELVIAMDVLGAEQNQLIANDEYGRSWYVNADFIGLTEDTTSGPTASFGAVFAVDDPIWKLLIQSTQTITLAGDAGTVTATITPIGNQPALPIITITPTSNGANNFGFTWQRFVTIINNSPNALNSYSIDITDGGIDTAAAIGAGKMLSNGDDLRIYVDGVDVKRWFGGGGINSATTTIWINLSDEGNRNVTLGANIAGAGVITDIEIENTAANVQIMQTKSIRRGGRVLIGSEIFVFTGVAGMFLTGVTRAERQTSAGAHTAGDPIYFIGHDVWLYYGNPNIAPYVIDDTYKPIIDLTTSTNTAFVYSTEYFTLDGLRPLQWKKGTYLPALNSRHYTATENTLTDPASVIGVWCVGSSLLWWMLYNPCGFVTLDTITGEKYSANGVFAAYLHQSEKGNVFDIVFSEAAPGAGAGWVALDAHTAISLTPGPNSASAYYLMWWLYGYTGPAGINENGMEIGAATFTLDSNKTPMISLAAEDSNFNLHSNLYNAATDLTIEIDISLPFLQYVIVDTKEKTVTLYDGSNQINAILDFPIRAEWFPLLPSEANAITITDLGNVTYLFTWEDRAL